jgi:hypothetical protein
MAVLGTLKSAIMPRSKFSSAFGPSVYLGFFMRQPMESDKPISPWPMALLGILVYVSAWLSYLKIKPINPKTKENYPHDNARHESKPLTPVLTNELKTIKPESDKPNTHKKRKKVHAYLKFGINVLTLLAVVWYACEARKQRVAMDRTFHQVQQQTTLMRQELIAHSAAVIDVSPRLTGFSAGGTDLRMEFPNSTRATAINVRGEYQILKQSLPTGKQIGKSQTAVINFPDLGPTDPVVGPAFKPDEDKLNLSEKEIDDIYNVRLTVTVKGSIHYWNGFDTTHKDFCFSFYQYNLKTRSGKDCSSGGGQFLLCESYPSVLKSAIKTHSWCLQKQ